MKMTANNTHNELLGFWNPNAPFFEQMRFVAHTMHATGKTPTAKEFQEAASKRGEHLTDEQIKELLTI